VTAKMRYDKGKKQRITKQLLLAKAEPAGRKFASRRAEPELACSLVA